MKMTMHIDADVLDQVIKITGAKSKTKAVEIALQDLARRHRLKQILEAGLGLTPVELRMEFSSGAMHEVAEDLAPYGQPTAR